jgi:hypothetical protein
MRYYFEFQSKSSLTHENAKYLACLIKISNITSIKIKVTMAGCWWLTPVILATQEAKIRKITDSKPAQANSHKTQFQKILSQKWAGGVTQGIGREFKL